MEIQSSAFNGPSLNIIQPLPLQQQTLLQGRNATAAASLAQGVSITASPASNHQPLIQGGAFLRGVSDSFESSVTASVQPSTMKKAGESMAIWGSREWLGKTIDRVTDASARQVQRLQSTGKDLSSTGIQPSRTIPSPSFKTYTQLLHLPADPIQNMHFKELLSPKVYWDRVRSNYKFLGHRLGLAKEGKLKFLPQGFTGRDFVKGTVIDANTQPIKDMLKGQNIGSGLARIGGFSFLGYDIYKVSKDTYKIAKSQEDGSFGSKARTYLLTGKAALGQTAKNVISWEIAGIGMALGSKILPGFTSVPIGGIVLGVLAATMAKKGMDKVVPTALEAEKSDSNPTQSRQLDFIG